MRMKYLEEKERCKSAPPPLDESDENLTPTKKRYKSGPANLDMFDSTLTDPDFAVEEDSFDGSDDDFEYGAAHNKTPKVLPKGSMQVNKKITRVELMAVTTPICARGLISIELQTWLLSSVINYLGGDVNQMGISKSSIPRERAKVIEHQGNFKGTPKEKVFYANFLPVKIKFFFSNQKVFLQMPYFLSLIF
ncbi:uncharacterized protein LOC136080624 [Hydra vulgaris]|uniref:Uncharacterized protein LOC136080624 n=1 Tax=Hydra vulgaris TaxID=6087 RepID=A0ABM4BWH6_HYDVU